MKIEQQIFAPPVKLLESRAGQDTAQFVFRRGAQDFCAPHRQGTHHLATQDWTQVARKDFNFR
jgi:hypothetical protein